MRTVTKLLSELRRPEKNVRLHTDKQLVEFRRSVEMFGQLRPIVCDENGVILAGNGLFETMLSMGRTEAECLIMDGLTEKQKKKLMLADNRIFDLGVDDMKAFDEIIAELGDDLDVPGFDDELLRTLMADDTAVDEVMSSYGVVDQGTKDKMATAAETYRKEAEVRAEQSHEAANAGRAEEAQPVSRCVVCPRCGEQIWL